MNLEADDAHSVSKDQSHRSSRLPHRARNHHSAHADGADLHDAQPIVHPLVPRGQAELITTDAALKRVIEVLRAAGSFAYDSEFIGERSYVPQLCLIQIGLPDRIYLIDPLTKVDLLPFWGLIADDSVEKVVHAGEQDVEPVFRLLARPPANLFDTQIAAGLVHLPYPLSLSKLVGEFVGARLGKGLTFTNWDQRPLSGQQLRYAADDVRYLPAAREELRRRLEKAGHAAYAAEESAQLCHGGPYRFDPEESYLKIRGATSLDPRNLAVLRELTIWRDAAARTADVPPRTFLKDEILLSLARSRAQNLEKLARVRGLPRPLEADHGAEIVAATMKALALPADKLPEQQRAEPSPREKFQCDALWAEAQTWCFTRGIDPNLVTSRQEVAEFRRAVLAGGGGGGLGEEIALLKGWRRKALGERLLEVVGKAAE